MWAISRHGGEVAADLLDGPVGLLQHLSEAEEAVGIGGDHALDEVGLDPLRERANHRHVEAGGIHAGEHQLDVEGAGGGPQAQRAAGSYAGGPTAPFGKAVAGEGAARSWSAARRSRRT